MLTPDDSDVTIDDLRAVAAVLAPAGLLPERSQSRAESLAGEATVLDVLDLGSDGHGSSALVAVMRVDGRDLIVPGRLQDGTFRRDPGVASFLKSGVRGAFTVETMGRGIPHEPARALAVDQSNDSVMIGDAMVKWQLDAAPSPAPDRLRALIDTDTVPPLRAIVTWQRPDGVRCTVLTAAEALPDADDGWTWAVELVRAHARGDAVDALTPFVRVGEMVALMHAALATTGITVWGSGDVARMYDECSARLAAAAADVEGPPGDRLRARRERIQEVIDGLRAIDETPVIGIHGDLHVGQVISSRQGSGPPVLAFVDFDGNPLLPAEERCAPQPPARDVAGMLASIDHVARVVNHRTAGLAPEPALSWIPLAQQAFLTAYRDGLRGAGRSELLDERLLPILMIDQELREYGYAAKFLPHWTYVPDAVITDLFADDVTTQEA